MTTQRTTRATQKQARQAAASAAKAREDRRRRVTTLAVMGTLLAVFGSVALLAFRGSGTVQTDASGVPYFAHKDAFRLPGLLDDRPVTLSDHLGKPVVVNFFASWCVYCNEELPGFVQVAKATTGQVDFIGVNTSDPGDGAAMARRFDLAAAGFSLAHDIGTKPASDLWHTFGSQGLPVTAFYDSHGKLVDFSGGMLTQAELEQRIKADFGVSASAPDASKLQAPVIPLIPMGAYELLGRNVGNPSFVALDLRSPSEFAGGHIPGAVNVDYQAGRLRDVIQAADPSANYFLYDESGSFAAKAAAQMHDAGFKHVYFIEGGFGAWLQQGLPTSG